MSSIPKTGGKGGAPKTPKAQTPATKPEPSKEKKTPGWTLSSRAKGGTSNLWDVAGDLLFRTDWKNINKGK